MSKPIVILDDEPDIVALVTLQLSRSGFQVKGFTDIGPFETYIGKHLPALIILDLMLPDTDGLEVCKQLRQNPRFANVPVIMLTAKAEESDKVIGLELGADDYVTKPFSTKELVARIKAVLRRRLPADEGKIIEIGDDLVINVTKHEVTVGKKKIELTSTEFKILQLLSSRRGWVFNRDQVLEYLWGQEKAVLDRTVDVHIKNLREKLGQASKYIKNIRGVGYKLEE